MSVLGFAKQLGKINGQRPFHNPVRNCGFERRYRRKTSRWPADGTGAFGDAEEVLKAKHTSAHASEVNDVPDTSKTYA